MTRVLIDTHAFLWFLFDDQRLSPRADEIIADPATQALVSIATLWEITIKNQLGKLDLGHSLESFFARFVSGRRLEVVRIEMAHLVTYSLLPFHHRDPFDRLLIAQAKSMNTPILTADPAFDSYGIPVLW